MASIEKNINVKDDNAYEYSRVNPNYGDRFKGEEFKRYKTAVYNKLSVLLLKNLSTVKNQFGVQDINSLQKTFRDGALQTGKSKDEMLVVKQNRGQDATKEEELLFNWLDFGDVNQLDLHIDPETQAADGSILNPASITLTHPDKNPFIINDFIGTMDISELAITEGLSEFVKLDKGKTDINRTKLKQFIDTDFTELSPITFTHMIEQYVKYKNAIPLFKFRTDDFWEEYGNSNDVPIAYRIQRFFEEWERIKQRIPNGFLSTYGSLYEDLPNVTDKELFGWETLTYLVREAQDLIGTQNPIYNQDDARSWLDRIDQLGFASGSLVIDRDYWKNLYNAMADNNVLVQPDAVFGCTDATALNYSSEATEDDGTCTYDESGFIDDTQMNIKVIGTGMNNNGPRELYLNNSQVYSEQSNRGLRMTVYTQASLKEFLINGGSLPSPKFDNTYDVYVQGSQNTMAQKILTGDWLMNDVFVITSYDAVNYNPLLVGALKTIGGCDPKTRNGLGSESGNPVNDSRTPYALVGSKGVGECGGYESVGDDGPYSPPSQVSINWMFDDDDTGIVKSPGSPEEQEDFIPTVAFEESFNDWQDTYSPSNYWFRSTKSGATEYRVGNVQKTDGPLGPQDGGIRIYRSEKKGNWPGAMYNPNTKNEHVNPTYIGEEPREPDHLYLQEDRKYKVELWGRCNTEDGKAKFFIGDTRGGTPYEWSKSKSWQTNGEWTKTTFEVTPTRNSRVSTKWQVGFYYDSNDNFGGSPAWPSTVPLKKTLYENYVNWDWDGGYMEVASNNVRVRAEGTFYAATTGTYTFRIRHDDGARMWVNGEKIINNWNQGGDRHTSGTIYLYANTLNQMKAEMYENEGHASFKIQHQNPGQSTWILTQVATKTQASTAGYSLPPLYEGVMANMYLYAGTNSGANPGEYCDYSNLKVMPLEGATEDSGTGGCTNPGATNYDPNETISNPSSCIFDTTTPNGCAAAGGSWNEYITDGRYYMFDLAWGGPNDNFGCHYPTEEDCINGTNSYFPNCEGSNADYAVFCSGGPYFDQTLYGSSYYQCDGVARKGGLAKSFRFGGKTVRTKPIASNKSRTAIPVSKGIDTYGTNNIIPKKTYGNKITFDLPKQTIKTQGEIETYKKLNPKVNTTYNNRKNMTCQQERDILNNAGSMNLQQLKQELENHLAHNSPCLSQKRKFNTGGRSDACCPTSCGDTNLDSNVNVVDVVLAVGAILGNETLTDEEFACADFLGDGVLNVMDIIATIDIIMGSGAGNPNCNVCDTDTTCTGLIGCDLVCYTEWNGAPINGAGSENLLPDHARYDASGVCGGGLYDCDDVCMSLGTGPGDDGNCDYQHHCLTMGATDINMDTNEIYVIPGEPETTPCMWSWGDGCLYGTLEKGGKVRRRR